MTDYEKVMSALMSVEGVTEHLNSLSVVLGRKLFGIRLEKGITQKELAEILNVELEIVAKVESGDKDIEVGLYNKFFKALDIDSIKIELELK